MARKSKEIHFVWESSRNSEERLESEITFYMEKGCSVAVFCNKKKEREGGFS